ncbi:MAG: hypothetical protein ABA06_04320 [Parcubacteria bacterium C7867-001]|nr:MAG: hypothetical protein ABA06_04320 [Parcubacteria bacterium C7867-001]
MLKKLLENTAFWAVLVVVFSAAEAGLAVYFEQTNYTADWTLIPVSVCGLIAVGSVIRATLLTERKLSRAGQKIG